MHTHARARARAQAWARDDLSQIQARTVLREISQNLVAGCGVQKW